MPIKSFKGLIADEGQDILVLHTSNGSQGYRIVKFMLMPEKPASVSAEHVVKIFTVEQTAVTGEVDFNDTTLIAAGFTNNYQDAMAYNLNQYTIFDNEIFNQDIFITHKDTAAGQACNYYIELELISLDLSQNTVATLKDIRNIDQG